MKHSELTYSQNYTKSFRVIFSENIVKKKKNKQKKQHTKYIIEHLNHGGNQKELSTNKYLTEKICDPILLQNTTLTE